VIGHTLSHYRIADKLGEGGMGVVYKAEDTNLERRLALKLITVRLLSDEDIKARFQSELGAVGESGQAEVNDGDAAPSLRPSRLRRYDPTQLLRFLLVSALCVTSAFPGDLTDRFDRTRARVLDGKEPRYDAELLLADLDGDGSRLFTDFTGDLSGRFLGATATVGRSDPRAAARAAELIEGILSRQRDDGGFGRRLDYGSVDREHMAQLWGLGRLLVGLVEFAEANGDDRSRSAALRLGDYLAELGPRLNRRDVRGRANGSWLANGYGCWTQNMEGLAALCRLSGERRYLDAARAIVPFADGFEGEHSHGRLSTLRGMLALAELSGDSVLTERVARAWESLAASGHVRLSGAVAEYLEPNPTRDEGCSNADWLRLSLMLWHLSGDPKYLEAAERSYFNGFLANQFANGDFGHRVFAERGLRAGGVRAWWCCTLHGLRAFSAVSASAFVADGDGLFYVLPVDGEGSSSGLRARAESTLSTNGEVRLTVLEAPTEPTEIRVRLPRWAAAVRLSREAQEGEGFVAVRRQWKKGEELRIEYELAAGELRDNQGGLALTLGPSLLGIDELTTPAYFGQPYDQVRLLSPPTDTAGRGGLEALPSVGFLVAGYPSQPGRAKLTPWGDSAGEVRRDYRFYLPGDVLPQASFVERVRRQTWFPFAAGGLLGVALGAGAILMLRRRSRTAW